MREAKTYTQKPKIRFNLVLIGFLISTTIIIATTPIHEAAHWVMSDIDPYVEPVEIHVFDEASYQNEEHILPSALGSVVIQEKYPGAFNDRPFWADALQELICISIQIFLAVIISYKIIKILINKQNKPVLSVNNF